MKNVFLREVIFLCIIGPIHCWAEYIPPLQVDAYDTAPKLKKNNSLQKNTSYFISRSIRLIYNMIQHEVWYEVSKSTLHAILRYESVYYMQL